MELIACELKQRPRDGAENEKQARYSYSAQAHDIDHYDKGGLIENAPAMTLGFCEFTATKQLEEKTKAEVTATYLFAFVHPDDPPTGRWSREQMTEFSISAYVWPKFRDLMAVMMSQGSGAFPPLPLTPDRITLAKGASQTPGD